MAEDADATLPSATVLPMSPRTVLVGYDGSPQADRAIVVAAALLPGRHAAVVTVWHGLWPSRNQLHEILNEHENVKIDDLAVRLREIGESTAGATAARGAERARDAGWEAHGLTRRSQQGVWFDLAALAGETAAEAVVLGADGGVGPLGRVADAVVRLADRPVLVVREDSPDAAANAPLVIGYDGSVHARRAISAAAALFSGRRAIVVHAGHLQMAEEGAQAATAAGLDAEALQVRQAPQDVVQPEGAAWHRLSAVADEHGASAIVVGARGTGALRRFSLGSVTSGLLHHARRPVLVVPESVEAGAA